MRGSLERIYEKTIERYRNDPAVVGAWEYGSLGKGTGDEYSDVDPVFMVEDSELDRVDAEPPHFSRDARDGCAAWGRDYPQDLELEIRAYLRRSLTPRPAE